MRTRQGKGNLVRETVSLQIAIQNNAIKTRYIWAKIDKTQLTSRCNLCGDRDETINHIISKCSKLAQKEYKTRRDCVGKVIHLELCKKLKFDHTNKWYMYNPVFVQRNETQTLLGFWGTNASPHLGLTPRLCYNQQQKNRPWKIVDFAVPADHRVKLKESEKKDKYLEKLWNMRVTVIPIVIRANGTVPKYYYKDWRIWE